jgi:hypothetical protein
LVGERRIRVLDGLRKDGFGRHNWSVDKKTKSVVLFSLCKAKLFGCGSGFLFGAYVVRKQLGISLVEKALCVPFY